MIVGAGPDREGFRALCNVNVGQTSLHIDSTTVNTPGICARHWQHIGEQIMVPDLAELSLVGKTDMSTTKNEMQHINTTNGEVWCTRGL